MSQENVETIARLYDEFLAKPERVFDPGVLRFFDPGVEIRQPLLGGEESFRGYDGLAHVAREIFEAFGGMHWVPTRLIDHGDRVVAIVEVRGHGKNSNLEANRTVAHVWTLREGWIVAWHVYLDTSQALEAVGLRA